MEDLSSFRLRHCRKYVLDQYKPRGSDMILGKLHRPSVRFCSIFALAVFLAAPAPVGAFLFRGCEDTPSLECASGEAPVSVEEYYPAIFDSNPVFKNHFDVYVCWRPGTAEQPGAPYARWNVADLQEFANYIVDPRLGDEAGLAKLVLDYFGEDVFPANDHFGINTAVQGQNQDVGFFKIYLFDTCRWITAGVDYISAHIEGTGGQYLLPEVVAHDAFLHEWQHVCHKTWMRVGYGIDSFDTFNEMCSVLAVAKYGREITGTGTSPYETSIANHFGDRNFTSACMNAVPVNQDDDPPVPPVCEAMYGNVYNDWAMFAIYLDNVFTLPRQALEDSLVYRWIREFTPTAEGGRKYHHDFPGLGTVLDDDQLDHLFSSSSASPQQRVNEAYRGYAMAKFLNLQTPAAGQEIYQWRSGAQPQELYNFLQDANGYCYDNIHTFPLYHDCTTARQEVSGWQRSDVYWPTDCQADEYSWYVSEWEKRRLVGVQTYASNYIVLRPPVGAGGDLSFSLRFLDEYPCMHCPPAPPDVYSIQQKAASYEGQAMLAVDLIGYDLPFPPAQLDPGTNGLDEYGSRMRVIETEWLEPAPNQVVDFNLGSFGTVDSDINAVAIVLSVVPKEGGLGNNTNSMVPFEYRYQTLPSNIALIPSVIDESNCPYVVAAGTTAWVLGEVVIEPGCELWLEEGARVYFRGSEAKITAAGGSLIARGSAAAPVEFLPSIHPDDTNTDYAGLFAEDMGLIDLQYCQLNDAVQIGADNAIVRIANSIVYMAENDNNAIVLDLQNGPRDPAFVSCEISNVNRIWLGSGSGRSAEIEGCMITQREDFQSLLSIPPPLVYCIEGSLSISETTLYFLRTGIQVGEKYMPGAPKATLGPYLTLRPHPAAAAPETGIQGRGAAEIEARYSEIWDVRVGVKVWDSAEYVMDHSKIHGCEYGLVSYARNGVVDLGSEGGASSGENFIAPSTTLADCWRTIPQTGDCVLDPTAVDMVRVYNATTTTITAERNSWGTCEGYLDDYGLDCMCPSAFFPPNPVRVDYSPWTPMWQMVACESHPEPPGFFLGAGAAPLEAEGAWPNPFNGQIQFRFGPSGATSSLEIFDILGRKIRDIDAVVLESGDREFIWRGETNAGQAATSGVYLYRLTDPGQTRKGKVVYVK
ncbi:T9SS type A sorting domain-containing protein [bacterium]|nr:T9SS type A sorting domain-containing protein [bacterium]